MDQLRPTASMLASVTDEREARSCVALGADIIDAKNPAAGALGALDHATVRAICASVPRNVPVSATIGDPGDDPEAVAEAVCAMAATGVDVVKIGLLPGAGTPATLRRLAALDLPAALVGVLLVDRGFDLDVDLVEEARAAGFAGLMLDTADKGNGALPDMLPAATLRDFVIAAQVPACSLASLAAQGRACALYAGLPARRLRLPRRPVPARRACGSDRCGRRAGGSQCHSRRRLPRAAAGWYCAPAIGRRVMSEQSIGGRRGAQTRLDGGVPDRIFVRGLVLPIAIGVYDEEQGVTQKVSFTIEAAVATGVAPKGDAIAEVPSYDDLVGAVRAIVAAGHINLVETLAERIAERCLSDKRIASVLVRVEKLERGPASVGVEIVRPR
jgi:dihydroneopterin aldolase